MTELNTIEEDRKKFDAEKDSLHSEEEEDDSLCM
jgi:hypothetical protein